MRTVAAGSPAKCANKRTQLLRAPGGLCSQLQGSGHGGHRPLEGVYLEKTCRLSGLVCAHKPAASAQFSTCSVIFVSP